jgi:hypothetical protein
MENPQVNIYEIKKYRYKMGYYEIPSEFQIKQNYRNDYLEKNLGLVKLYDELNKYIPLYFDLKQRDIRWKFASQEVELIIRVLKTLIKKKEKTLKKLGIKKKEIMELVIFKRTYFNSN